MLQRVQTIYLGLTVIISVFSSWFADLWKSANVWLQAEDNVLLLSLFLGSACIALVCIFLFKNRKLQLKLNYLNILLNVLLIVLLIYNLWNLPGGFNSEKGIGLFVPLVLIALLFMANQRIKKDEKLVKSIDRIR